MVTSSSSYSTVLTAAVYGALVQEAVLLARPQETLVHRKEPNGTARDVVKCGEQNRHDPGERDENDLWLLHLGPRRFEEVARQQGVDSVSEIAQHAKPGSVLQWSRRLERTCS